jgi:hypothetical protein
MDKLDILLQLIRGFLSFNSDGEASVKTTDSGTVSKINELVAVADNINTAMTDGTQVVQTIVPTTLTTLTVNTSAETGLNTNVPAGALYIEFITSSNFVGTIGGISIPALAVKTYPYIQGCEYPQIDFLVTSGTLYLTYITLD